MTCAKMTNSRNEKDQLAQGKKALESLGWNHLNSLTLHPEILLRECTVQKNPWSHRKVWERVERQSFNNL